MGAANTGAGRGSERSLAKNRRRKCRNLQSELGGDYGEGRRDWWKNSAKVLGLTEGFSKSGCTITRVIFHQLGERKSIIRVMVASTMATVELWFIMSFMGMLMEEHKKPSEIHAINLIP